MAVGEFLIRSVDGDSPFQPAEVGDVIKNADAINGNPVAKTSDYSVTDEDSIILADESGGAVTITLPAPSWAGESYIIKRTSGAANGVTVATADSATIDGSATQSLAAQWDSIKVVSDGTDWFIVASV